MLDQALTSLAALPLSVVSSLVIILASAAILGIERVFPYDTGQKVIREGFWNDLILYSVVQSFILGWVINHIIQWLDTSSSMSRQHLLSDWPVWAQVLLFLVTHDFYIYWFHRIQHRNKFLWRIHEAHHSTTDVDWLSGSRSHSLEILINQTIEFTPIILLGAAPEVWYYKVMISAIWGMYIHSNINVRTGPLQYVINGPEMHRWHHSSYAPDGSFNFATKIAVWDWLFGTAHNPHNVKPKAYGIEEVDFPKSYLAQHAFAFRSFKTDPTFMKRKVSPLQAEGQGSEF